MGEDEKVSVLACEQDVHLLREIAKWRRAAGIDLWRSHGNLGRFTNWSEIGSDGHQVSIDFERSDEGWRATMTIGRRRELGGMKIDDTWTLTEAVDVLVAVGYLPARFSSAYRLGWDKANGFAQARATRMWIPPSEFAACEPAAEPVF